MDGVETEQNIVVLDNCQPLKNLRGFLRGPGLWMGLLASPSYLQFVDEYGDGVELVVRGRCLCHVWGSGSGAGDARGGAAAVCSVLRVGDCRGWLGWLFD